MDVGMLVSTSDWLSNAFPGKRGPRFLRKTIYLTNIPTELTQKPHIETSTCLLHGSDIAVVFLL
eukprot:879904-Pelagomonas_calceolata.AAC.1